MGIIRACYSGYSDNNNSINKTLSFPEHLAESAKPATNGELEEVLENSEYLKKLKTMRGPDLEGASLEHVKRSEVDASYYEGMVNK